MNGKDLTQIMHEEIVNVKGRKMPVMCFDNDKRKRQFLFVGRGGGESIQLIIINYSQISPKKDEGSLIFKKPYNIETFWGKGKEHSRDNGYDHGFFKIKLEGREIWEKE
ncbi:hypothetical protein KAT24_02835 [Candidatus Pacearchaeota archaeon]|nr:hypothetical protein [Candidatus Pacearchaeota archaeon]